MSESHGLVITTCVLAYRYINCSLIHVCSLQTPSWSWVERLGVASAVHGIVVYSVVVCVLPILKDAMSVFISELS